LAGRCDRPALSDEWVRHFGTLLDFFSLEMSAEQLPTRIIAERTALASSAMRRGDIKSAINVTNNHHINGAADPRISDEDGLRSFSPLPLCGPSRPLCAR
jgi:hypothetical protein